METCLSITQPVITREMAVFAALVGLGMECSKLHAVIICVVVSLGR